MYLPMSPRRRNPSVTWAGLSPGYVEPSTTRFCSIPRTGALLPSRCRRFAIGAEPMNTHRAARFVAMDLPRILMSLSMRFAVDVSPAMSASTMGFHASSRWLVSSSMTFALSKGTIAGRIIGDLSPLLHNADTTVAMRRSTPRVRWNRSNVDQSLYRRSNSSGWIGYAVFITDL